MSDLVWHAADGSLHIQDTQAGLQGVCECESFRHRLGFMGEDAARARICPGVAHTWPAGRPCVLCRSGWRVPGAAQGTGYVSQDSGPAQPVRIVEIGPGAFMETVGTPRQCIYCTSLAGAPEALTAHRALMHA